MAYAPRAPAPSADQLFKAALAHHQAQRLPEAIAGYQAVIRLAPQAVQPHNNLGALYRAMGEHERAIESYARALRIQPRHARAHANLGNVLLDGGRMEEAERAFRRAVALEPAHGLFHHNLAVALHKQRRLDEARASGERAVELDPSLAEAHKLLGRIHIDEHQPAAALACYDRVLELEPENAVMRHDRALVYLLTGDYERGWREYEWRWRHPGTGCHPRQLPRPLWRGEPLHGRRILVHTEQGLGDTLMMVRFARLLEERGARVIVECRPEMRRLLAGAPGVHELAVVGAPLPDFDLYVPLMSLPRLFGTRVETIPAEVPYLRAPRGEEPGWLARVRALPGRKVGLVWAGSPFFTRDADRSVELETLRPLLERRDLSVVSLQKGPALARLESTPGAERIVSLGPELRDFADTALAVAELDLLVSVDTSVAHLGGALGVPTWVMLDWDNCWRWLEARSDSPWYPTARLFRQGAHGDWAGVVREMAAALDDG